MSKVYAVRHGRKSGIYNDWSSCQEQIKGFSGAEFKSFKSEEEAQVYLYGGIKEGLALKKPKSQIKTDNFTGYLEKDVHNQDIPVDTCRAYVCGSYNPSKRCYSFGCVFLTSDKEYQLGGCDNIDYLLNMQSISGELLGTMIAVNLAIELGKSSIQIYHKLEGTSAWAEHIWRSKKRGTIDYVNFIDKCSSQIDISFVQDKKNIYFTASEKLAKKSIASGITVNSREFFNEDDNLS